MSLRGYMIVSKSVFDETMEGRNVKTQNVRRRGMVGVDYSLVGRARPIGVVLTRPAPTTYHLCMGYFG